MYLANLMDMPMTAFSKSNANVIAEVPINGNIAAIAACTLRASTAYTILDVFPLTAASQSYYMYSTTTPITGIEELVVMVRDNSGTNTYTGKLKDPTNPDSTYWTDAYRA